LFDDGSASLFKDEKAVHTHKHYPPADRDDELQRMAAALDPIRRNQPPTNLFLYGPPGTGKSTCTRHLLHKLEDYDVQTQTVNCTKYNSRSSVLTQLLPATSALSGKRGLGADEKLDRIQQRLDRTSITVALEEFDRLEDADDILYDLYTVAANTGNEVGVILLSDKDPEQLGFDPRNASRLDVTPVEFEPYEKEEIVDVMQQRVQEGFRNGVVDDGVVDRIAERVAHEISDGRGDMRRAINLLRVSGQKAKHEGASTVTVAHVEQAFNPARSH